MNTKNNRRKRESRAKMESVFVELLQTNELNQITVSDICKLAGVNRSTFYANYEDIYALADVVRSNLEQEVAKLYQGEVTLGFNSNDYLKLFRHIAENQLFYQTYFKLGYDNQYKIVKYDRHLAETHFNNRFISYHMEFFKGGLNTIIKMWLASGCKETPEEMNEIVTSEYKGRAEYFGET
ncbi:MAG: TetR/AcrR family transcriptional regulator [Candidatus Heteroscillospira sp.]|jgi:AcrR family transcriptional regulator